MSVSSKKSPDPFALVWSSSSRQSPSTSWQSSSRWSASKFSRLFRPTSLTARREVKPSVVNVSKLFFSSLTAPAN